MMIRREYYNGPKVIEDLNNFNPVEKSITIFGKTKNINRLRDLDITHLWIIGAKNDDLIKILSLVKPQFVSVYQVLATDLSILETLTDTETIVLRWNTKCEELWNMANNNALKSLVIEDFSKITSVEPIKSAINLDYLILEGGMWKPLKIDTLKPLAALSNLRELRLANIQVKEDGLQPIGELMGLKELMLSNQFETKDYAYLSVKLPETKCDYFKPYIVYDRPIGNNDTMITGKRKPFLNSKVDKDRIKKYESEFYDMVTRFSKASR